MHPFSAHSKIFVAGHRGLVGSAIVRALTSKGYQNLVVRTRSELDLRNQSAVAAFFKQERPDAVFLAAARVGGISANDRFRGDFILENLQIQTNVIGSAFESGVRKLIFMGSSCIYPKHAHQPMDESQLLTGTLEVSNEAYAVAKIAGLMLCKSLRKQYGRDFTSLMPTNLYGPGDNYDLENSHVLPALLRRFHEAKLKGARQVVAWGTGSPLREFLFSDDLAAASVFALENPIPEDYINVGTGEEVSIRDLTELVKRTVGFNGDITWDHEKPDGTPRKLLDSSRIQQLGWKPKVSLSDGLRLVYADFQKRFQS